MADPYTGVVDSGTDSAFAGNLPVYYKRKTEALMKAARGLSAKIDLEPFPTRSGTTATFAKIMELPDNTTPLTQGENPAARQIVTGSFTAAIAQFGDVVAPSDLAELTTIEGIKRIPLIVANQGRNSVESYFAQNTVKWLMPVSADANVSSDIYGDYAATADGAANGTTIVASDFASADNTYRYGIVTITSQTHKDFGRSREVTSSTAVGTLLNFTTAWSAQITTGTTFRYGLNTGMSSDGTDKITLATFRMAAMLLRKNGAWGDEFEVEGGGYNAVWDAELEHDIQLDTTLINLFIYKEKESGLRDYKPGMLMMMKPTLTHRPFRSAVGTPLVYSATGSVHHVAVFGRNAMAKLPLAKNDIEVIVKSKESGGVSNPLEMYSTLGWKYTTAVTYKNACAGAQIWCDVSTS